MNTRHRKRRQPLNEITGRAVRMSIQVNKEEYDLIAAASAQAGIGMASYIRAMTFQGQLIARLTEEEKFLFRNMINVAQGLNQMILIAREKGMEELQPVFES